VGAEVSFEYPEAEGQGPSADAPLPAYSAWRRAEGAPADEGSPADGFDDEAEPPRPVEASPSGSTIPGSAAELYRRSLLHGGSPGRQPQFAAEGAEGAAGLPPPRVAEMIPVHRQPPPPGARYSPRNWNPRYTAAPAAAPSTGAQSSGPPGPWTEAVATVAGMSDELGDLRRQRDGGGYSAFRARAEAAATGPAAAARPYTTWRKTHWGASEAALAPAGKPESYTAWKQQMQDIYTENDAHAYKTK
jgi:hypothetical protein